MRLLCSIVLLLPSLVFAQQAMVLIGEVETHTVRVRGVMDEVSDASPVLLATWRFAAAEVDPVMEFQRTSVPDNGVELALDKLLLAGIGAYLDGHVHFEKQGVKADLAVPVLVRQINGMVRAATNELGEGDGVSAISEPTMKQLERLCKIDWSQARFGVDGGADQDKYLAIYYYVKSQRDELERQLRNDLLPLASVPVLKGEALPPGRTFAVNSVCGSVFDDLGAHVTASAIGIAHERAVVGQALDEAEHAKSFLEDPLVRPKLLERSVLPEFTLADQRANDERIPFP